MEKKIIKELQSRWYYLPHKKWFNNRKDAKEYLGGTNKFNQALKNRLIIYIEI